MPATISDEVKAQAIVDAIYYGDVESAKKNGVSRKSIQRWRDSMPESPTLSHIVQDKLEKKDESWAEEIPASLKAGIEWLKDAFTQASKRDPRAIEAVTEGLKALAEIAITREMIDARIARQTGEARQET